jgi:hypothetical protein
MLFVFEPMKVLEVETSSSLRIAVQKLSVQMLGNFPSKAQLHQYHQIRDSLALSLSLKGPDSLVAELQQSQSSLEISKQRS